MPVIPAQAGIQTLAFKEYLGMMQFQTSRFPPAREWRQMALPILFRRHPNQPSMPSGTL